MTNKNQIIVIDSDDDNDEIIEVNKPNNNKTPQKPLSQQNNNNYNANNLNKNINNNINLNNINHNDDDNKLNNINNISYSRANYINKSNNNNNNNNNFNFTNKSVIKSSPPKYNKNNLGERRKFLADRHEERLSIGKSIQYIEIDEDFFDNDDKIRQYNIKQENEKKNNNIKQENDFNLFNQNNNINNINKPPEISFKKKAKNNTTTTTTTTTTTSTTNNIPIPQQNNDNIRGTNNGFDYQASINIRKQLESIRKNENQEYRKNKFEKKKMFNLNDIEQLRKQDENEKMIAKSIETTINNTNNKNIHTINNTILNPEQIGRKALELTNEFRKSQGLQDLLWNQDIYKIGCEHSKNMGEKRVEFGHDGFKERVKKFPFKFKSVGENVAYTNSNSNIAEQSVEGWINSPGHRKNLVGNFNICSIGVFKNNEGFWYLTQLFALQTSV